MGRPSRDWESEIEDESVSREQRSAAAAAPVPAGSLAWASAVGNQAVQRLARRTVAREAVAEEEEIEEAEPLEDVAPAAEESPPGDFAPEDADGLAALDDLPEDELPE